MRLRVAGLTLHVRAARATSLLAPPPSYRRFVAARGGDIRLELVEEQPPEPSPGSLLFDSGGVWRVHRHGPGLLYTFRAPRIVPAVYKAVAIDGDLRRGRLYFPPSTEGVRPRFAADYPLDELLFQHRLAREGALEVHACGLFAAAKVALFCGQSGAGKSTTARLWRRHRPRTRILSDDRIVLRDSGSGVRAHGTPWHGDGGYATSASGLLGAVFFLKHARATRLRRLGEAEAAARLLARSFPPPWDAAALARALELCARTVSQVPCFELRFRPKREAVETVEDFFTRPAGQSS